MNQHIAPLAQHWVTYVDAAGVLSVSDELLRSLVREGRAPIEKVGSVRLLPRLWLKCVLATGAPMVYGERTRYDWDAALEAYKAVA